MAVKGIDDWAQERRVHRRSGGYVDTNLTKEQHAVILDAYKRGYGVVSICKYMREAHGCDGLTQGALQHWLDAKGASRAG